METQEDALGRERDRMKKEMGRARVMLSIMHTVQADESLRRMRGGYTSWTMQRIVDMTMRKSVSELMYVLRERGEVNVVICVAIAIQRRDNDDLSWVTDELLNTLLDTLYAMYCDHISKVQDEALTPPAWWRRHQRATEAATETAWRQKCTERVTEIQSIIDSLYRGRLRHGNVMPRMTPNALQMLVGSNVSLLCTLLFGSESRPIMIHDEKSTLGHYIGRRDLPSLRVLLTYPLVTEQPWYDEMGRDAFLVCGERGWYEGAQLCFDLFPNHRTFFVDHVVLHVLRYPAKRYAHLAGFLHYRRAAVSAVVNATVDSKLASCVMPMMFCLHTGDVEGVKSCWHVLGTSAMNQLFHTEHVCQQWMQQCVNALDKKKKDDADATLSFTAGQLSCLAALIELGTIQVFVSTMVTVLCVKTAGGSRPHLLAFVRAILMHRNEPLFRAMLRESTEVRDVVEEVLFAPDFIVQHAHLLADAPSTMRQPFLLSFPAYKVKVGDAGKNLHRITLSTAIFNVISSVPYEHAAFLLTLLEVEYDRETITAFFRAYPLCFIDTDPDVLLLLRNTFGADALRHLAVHHYALSIPQMRRMFGDDESIVMWRSMHDIYSDTLLNWWLQHESMSDLALLQTHVGDRMIDVVRWQSNNVSNILEQIFLEPLRNPAALDVVYALLSDAQRQWVRESPWDPTIGLDSVPDDQVLAVSVWLARSLQSSINEIAALFQGTSSYSWLYASTAVVEHMETLLETMETAARLPRLFSEQSAPNVFHELARAVLNRGTPNQKYNALFLLIEKGLPVTSRSLFRTLATQPDVYPLLCEPRIHNMNNYFNATLLEYAMDRTVVRSPFSPNAPMTTMSLLLSLPILRQQAARLAAMQSFRSAASVRRQIAELDTSRESSMRQFSLKERAVLDHLREVYGDTITTRGVPAILADLQRALRAAYETEPAVYRDRPLPFSYTLLVAACREWAAEENGNAELVLAHAKAAYHANVWHTAARWFLKPNPWIHPHAGFVNVDGHDHSKRWAAGMESDKIRYLVAMYWLAATDTATVMLNGATVRDNTVFFARTLALINRGHNYDTATRTRKLPGGGTATDEVDDGEGDRPSCSMGLEQRFFTSVPANPHAHYNDIEERLVGAITSRLLAKVRALDETERVALVNAMQDYVIDQTLDAERTFLIMTHNLSEEEQAACAAEAGASEAVAAPYFATTDECLHSHVLQYIPTFYY